MKKMVITKRDTVPKEHIIFIKMTNMKKNTNFMMNITKVEKMKNMEVSTNTMTSTK